MSQLTDSMYQDRRAVIRDVTQAQFDAQRGNYKPDVIYRVDGVAMYMPVRNGHYQSSMPRLTFSELSAAYPPSASIAGMHAWCTDYPSVGGYGAEVVCTGSRWKAISQQHCLLSPPSAVAGVLFAAGSAAELYGSTALIPGGVLQTDDNIRLLFAAQHPTLGTATRRVDINFATTSGGVVAGSSGLGYLSGNGTNNNINVEKMATLTGPVNSRSNNVSLAGVATSTNSLQANLTIPTIADDIYAGIVVTPSADTSWLMYAATVYVEFAR